MTPYVLVSCVMSVDGFLDDATDRRLLLSGAEDFDRVDALRAGSDAILVGAGTLRSDNPRLLVNSAERRAARVTVGLPEHPLKVTVTGTGALDPALRFWHTGGEKAVYAPDAAVGVAHSALGDLAVVIGTGASLDLARVLADLGERGVRRLMVEGGTSVLTQFLTAGLVDELQLAIAPFFVGAAGAPRLVGPGSFPHDATRRMTLAGVGAVGDIAVLRYLLRGAP